MPIENVGNVRLLSITADSTLDCGVPSGGAGMKVNPSVSVLHLQIIGGNLQNCGGMGGCG